MDYHCRNLGDGSFEHVSQQVGTTNGGSDMGVAVGDIENDGDLDIYSTNIGIGVLYVNDGTGHFSNDALAHGVGSWGFPPPTGWGTVFGDFDNDLDNVLVRTAVLQKNNMVALLCIKSATAGAAICRVDPREMP